MLTDTLGNRLGGASQRGGGSILLMEYSATKIGWLPILKGSNNFHLNICSCHIDLLLKR